MPLAERQRSGGQERGGRGLGRQHGFSLPEMLIVAAIFATVSAIAIPQVFGALERYRTNSAVREVAAQIRAARLAAVTTNRVMIVRFNCPSARAYRFVEVTGDPAIDSAADRCSFPPADSNPATLPNADGPLSLLPETMTFAATQDLRIGTTGVVTPLAGAMPALIQVTNGALTGQITVSASGRVQMQ
jgi:prepilin-type N-terminal cleavage/methylation domain-containing protein